MQAPAVFLFFERKECLQLRNEQKVHSIFYEPGFPHWGLEWILHKVCLEIFQPAAENETLQRYRPSATQIQSWAEVCKAAEGSWTAEFTLILIRIRHSDPANDSRGYQPWNLYKPQPSSATFLQNSNSSKYLSEPAETERGAQPATHAPAPTASLQPYRQYGSIS